MKKNLFWALAALLLIDLLPLTRPALRELPGASPAVETPRQAVPAGIVAAGEGASEAGEGRTIRVLCGGETKEFALEDYLLGVVAAEMPASFPEEALKAQAVAARTFALYCAAGEKHAETDICTDPGCCQAWIAEDRLRENWGEDYEANLARIRRAVESTAGQVLLYEGTPVFAAFHSSSAGATEDCGALWNPRPYLVSVSSPETAGDVPGYLSTLRCAPLDFRDTILSACPQADFSGPEENWIGALRLDASGRVESLELGGVVLSGTELRRLFSLRSTAFTLAYTEGVFVFSVTGFGHGVGMSQYGAKVMAQNGADYTRILAHYYPGTTLGTAG